MADSMVTAPVGITNGIAKQLMCEYRSTLGKKKGGGSEISRRIGKYTRFAVPLRNIGNWLNGSTDELSSLYFDAVLAFMRTAHFQQAVPHARDYFDANARLIRHGTTLFEIYGSPNEDRADLEKWIARCQGWWITDAMSDIETRIAKNSYILIQHLPGHPFGAVYFHDYFDKFFQGASGIIFPSHDADILSSVTFSTKLWSRFDYQERSVQIQGRMRFEKERQTIGIVMRVPYDFGDWRNYQQTNETDIKPEINQLFDNWKLDVIPHGITEKKTNSKA